ncbi:DUF4199 domain-containing protein [Alteriqipengyuania sp.]|uniref:DUF4199 domain-containing protein n=1 Tax=Alteriqipengyuania sp. TaxID=2800692 RepID=UPI00351669CE
MFRYAAIYGAIAGTVIIAIMTLVLMLGGDENYGFSEVMGYLIMIAVLSLIFIGIKRYRDVEKGGVIRFGPAFALGLAITAVAAVFYVASWEVYLASTDYAFIQSYSESQLSSIEAKELSVQEREAAIAEVESARTLYGNLPFRLMITFVEIFPVGLLVALVSAAILRNPKVLPARQPA